VRAGAFTETVQVRVEKGGEKFGGKKPDTQRDGRLGQVVPVANKQEFIDAMKPVYGKFANTPKLQELVKRIQETK